MIALSQHHAASNQLLINSLKYTETADFTDNSASTLHRPSNQYKNLSDAYSVEYHSKYRLAWNAPLNSLIALFIDLASRIKVNGIPCISLDQVGLGLFIFHCFHKKDGKDFCPQTIISYLNPEKESKLPKTVNPKRINLSNDLFDK